MSSWNNAYENSTNNSSTPDAEWSPQELSGLTKFLAVLLLVIGLLGITSGAMYLGMNALRAAGINPTSLNSPTEFVPPASVNANTETSEATTSPTATTEPATNPVRKGPQFTIPEPTTTELIVSSIQLLAGMLVSLGMIISSIQTLRRRRSGAIWLSNFCILSLLLVLTWGLQVYFFYENFKKPFDAIVAAQENLPADIPPERIEEFQERMRFVSQIGMTIGLACAGFFSLLHFLLYLIGAIHFRSERVLERMQREGVQ
jgi:hypothetical protein